MTESSEAACHKRTLVLGKQFTTVSQALPHIKQQELIFKNVAVQVKPETADGDVGTQMSCREYDDSIIIDECANLLEVLLIRRGIPPAKRRGCQDFIKDTVDAVDNSYKANVYNLVFGVAKALGKNTTNNDKQVL